ncbi:MAG: site-2 protease family protein [Clostridia bacterium]|nr:site-2 protease family protein [Clostridia bacterium]
MIQAIVIFGFLILTHELGHFIAAKWARITVLEFSIGMGPVLYQWTSGETDYSLRLLPIGGFVRMQGEDNFDEDEEALPLPPPEPEGEKKTFAFPEVPLWKRFIVISAGAMMNFITALLVMLMLVGAQGVVGTTEVAKFDEDSLSSRSGLMVGDVITAVNGRSVHITTDVIYALLHAGDDPCTIEVERDGQKLTLSNVAFPVGSGGYYELDFLFRRGSFHPLSILHEGFFRCLTIMREVYWSLGGMFTGEVSVNDLSGPVGTTQAISQVSQQGFGALVYFAVFISINLGIVNLLPFPALDGGRLALLLLEKLRGKPLSPAVEGSINMIGMLILMALVVLVTFKDVRMLVG